MQTYPRSGRVIIEIAGIDQPLYLQSLQGAERLSRLYHLDITVVTTGPALVFEDIIGQTVVITVEGPTPQSVFHGVIHRCRLSARSDGALSYRLAIGPAAWRLSQNLNSRIFQHKHVADIVKQLLTAQRIEHRIVFSEAPPVREYCVQHRESDWAFINRLLEEEGFYYFFTHQRDKEILVIANDAEVHPAIAGTPVVRYQPTLVTESRDEHIFDLSVSEGTCAGSFTLRDYNLEKPDIDLEQRFTQGKKDRDIEAYEFPGWYEEPNIGKNLVRVRREEGQVGRAEGLGSSTCTRFRAGATCGIEDYIHPLLDRGPKGDNKILITSVTHFIEQDVLTKKTEDVFRYQNGFTCIPAAIPFRPARSTPRPVMSGVQTAIVVGPAGQEIYPDTMGRVKVQFPWDREGKSNENSSCWVPVMQRWAGAGWGTMFVPRIGQQVIIDFIDANPDRPIIVGQVYQPVNPPPYDPSATLTISTIKTHSSPGGSASNFNEIKFEDKKGSEELYVQAEKNNTVLVKNDRSESVGHNHSESIGNNRSKSVGNDQSESVGNNKTITVGGTHTETIVKDTAVTVVQGNHTFTVGAGNQSTTIAQNKSESIGSSMSLSVGSAKTETVALASAETVGAAKALTVGGAYAVTVGGAMNVAVGLASMEEVGLTKQIIVGNSFEITCGDSSLSMDSDGNIKITGKKIEITGPDGVVIVGDPVDINP